VTPTVFPPPAFVDDGRSLLAKHPRDYWRALLDNPVYLDLSGYYLVTRRQDVVAALHDHATFASARKPMTAPVAGVRTLPMPVPIAYDPPEHMRFRRKPRRVVRNWARPHQRLSWEKLRELPLYGT